MQGYYIGLMSGTSIDGIDAALVKIDDEFKLISSLSMPWPKMTGNLLHRLCEGHNDNELELAFEARLAIAHRSTCLIQKLLQQANLSPSDIIAIGSHGQTVRHHPKRHYSVQLDQGPFLANLSHIDTIFDFRMADLACDGEGAPLTPIFHQLCLKNKGHYRFILNLGGISNLTILDKEGKVIAGFDCGPANTLMDGICRDFYHQEYDKDAQLALQGEVKAQIIDELSTIYKNYLEQKPPKSTGRELFNQQSINALIEQSIDAHSGFNGYDLLASLNYFTALCVVDAIAKFYSHLDIDNECDLIVCGGGAYNPLLMRNLQSLLDERLHFKAPIEVRCADDIGHSAKLMEAEAFAFFAYLFKRAQSLDLHDITGSEFPAILGCLSPAHNGHYQRLIQEHLQR